jgi:hypothetical protein
MASLRREDLALLKTALAVIVVQKRLRHTLEEEGGQTSKGEATVPPPEPKKAKAPSSVAAAPLPTSLPLILIHDEENPSTTSSDVSTMNSLPWKSHLQHVVQLIWKQTSSVPIVRTKQQRWYSLCVHVACQLEQLVALAPEEEEEDPVPPSEPRIASSNQTTPVSLSEVIAWFAEQLSRMEENSSDDDGTQWFTIWSTIASIKPEVLSEYFVGSLLDLLLLRSAASKTTGTPALAVPKVLYLELLEFVVLQVAPEPVRAWTRRILQHPYHQEGGTQDTASNLLPLLPASNGSWYSTTDLAYEYYAHQFVGHRAPAETEPEDIGERLLLIHGLAALSERLG